MPDNKHRNPFENHINSESFNVSHLGSTQERSDFDIEMDTFLNSLPEIINHSLYDRELDARQQAICSYLIYTLNKKILRDEHGESLEDIDDTELNRILTTSVAIGLLAQQHLNQPEPEPVIEPRAGSYRDDFSELPSNFGDILNEWFLKAKDFLISLIRKN